MSTPSPTRTRLRLRVEGVVQGVGFRPWVHRTATALGLAGSVANDGDGVCIDVEGPATAVDAFHARLRTDTPPLAVVERIVVETRPFRGDEAFVIAPSRASDERNVAIPPDIATCDACLAELFDPQDRRFRYPFINCTDCGPRFTIVQDVPYDRARTTMSAFAMCTVCRAEYEDAADRRFHAEPNACWTCGPRLDFDGAAEADPILAAAAALREGAIVAVKGLGGYHLVCDAAAEDAVARLRSRKHREEKPFAIMARDLAAAATLCSIDEEEARALTGPRRPIVLLRRRPGAAVAPSVAPGNSRLGVMLPYTPLHHLLLREVDAPLVMTSGNRSDEPIAFDDDDAAARLAPIADAFLRHDRRIHVRCDDSVVRVERRAVMPLRRARGYAPQPLPLPFDIAEPVLACGAELKNTLCVAKGRRAFVSHHIGDVEDLDTWRAFLHGVDHFRRLFDVEPRRIAYDLHPEYLTSKWALEQTDVTLVGVQHHHAHIASCMVDNGVTTPVIGVAFDGLGYGHDGTLWGGEFLVADLAGAERVGHLASVPLPGGGAAIAQPWRMAMVHLARAFGEPPEDLDVVRRMGAAWPAVRSIRDAPRTSSMGRLFDAVAALCGVRDASTYEGQAAIELEQLADEREEGSYGAPLTDGTPFEVDGSALVGAAATDLRAGVPAAVVAGRFHNAVAGVVLAACARVRAATGLRTVALSGGVFQNVILTSRTVRSLERDGFTVLTHRRVPPNDGGIALGQVAVATLASRSGLGVG